MDGWEWAWVTFSLVGIVSPGRQLVTVVPIDGGSAGVPSGRSSLMLKVIRFSFLVGWEPDGRREPIASSGQSPK
jgi:hypothetical protein